MGLLFFLGYPELEKRLSLEALPTELRWPCPTKKPNSFK